MSIDENDNERYKNEVVKQKVKYKELLVKHEEILQQNARL